MLLFKSRIGGRIIDVSECRDRPVSEMPEHDGAVVACACKEISGWREPDTIDDALVYIQAHRDDERPQENPTDIRHLKRKVDFYVITFLMLCYMLNFLDKVLLNVRSCD